MYANIRGTKIYFDVDGVGAEVKDGKLIQRPVIFLLHGGPGANHRSYKSQLSELTDIAQLVYIDHRGNGESSRDEPDTWDLDNHVDDVDALRAHLGLERIHVLGGSYGGMVALGYACRYPERLASLVPVVTAASHHFMDDAKQYLAEHASEDQKRICEHLWNGTFESDDQIHEYYRLMGPSYSKTFDVEKFEKGWQPGLYNYDQLNRAFAGYLRTFDLTDQLHKITCQTLVIGGADDWICAPRFSQQIAKLIPRAHLKIFDNCGHSVGSDQKEAYLRVLRGFFTAVTDID